MNDTNSPWKSIVRNKNREMEVHLPKAKITSLGKSSFNVDGVNLDPDGDFIF